jgi:hypothetical protein
MGDSTTWTGFGGWLDKVRAMVPARTLSLYVAITGAYASFWPISTDLPVWVPIVVTVICLAFQLILGISRKKKVTAIVLSAIAFVLLCMAQPYSGILGVFEVSGAVNFVAAGIVVAYCMIVPLIYTGNLAEEAAGM